LIDLRLSHELHIENLRATNLRITNGGYPPCRPGSCEKPRSPVCFRSITMQCVRPPAPFAGIAQLLASDLRRALDVAVEVLTVPEEALLAGSRALVEKKLDQPWDLLVHAWFDMSSEAPPAVVHREVFGRDGAFRVGPEDPGFDRLFARMAVELDGTELVGSVALAEGRLRKAGLMPRRLAAPARGPASPGSGSPQR
jgi:hypothetical protein